MKDNLVICPVYNERETIKEFYHQLRMNYSGDVLFVDDGSTDGGGDILIKVKDSQTVIVRHQARYGYGAALLSGFRFARKKNYTRVVTIDVDLQHNPEHIPRFLRELIECEVALGSRYIRIDKYFKAPRSRLLINRYISRLLDSLFSVGFTDPFCGMRGYRISFLNRARLREASYGIALEILMEAIRLNASFHEIPIEVIYANSARIFLDGLNDSRTRLFYYLTIVARKKREIEDEKKVSICQSTSR